MTEVARILVVDDEPYSIRLFEELFRGKPVALSTAQDGAMARRLFAETDFNLVIMDQRLPGESGLDILREMRGQRPLQLSILITGYADVRDALRAVREGVFDYQTKPFENLEALEAVIARALELDRAYREIGRLKNSLKGETRVPVIGISAAIERLMQQVGQIAKIDTTVLIEGESGTGKSLLARSLHTQSQRQSGKFVEVNCGALPESLLESTLFGYERGAFTGAVKTMPGMFEAADHGTLFLDEVADMSPKLQASLLHVLQERSFSRLGSSERKTSDFRLVCATNKPLLEQVKAGSFREDLYYRINVVDLRIPALRQRDDDIVLLAVHFLQHFTAKFSKEVGPFVPDAIELLQSYSWPGNVRQLEHLVERVVALHSGGPITASDLDDLVEPAELTVAEPSTEGSGEIGSYHLEREAFERKYLVRLLEASGGNVSKAARLSGIPRQNLYVRMKRWGIVTEQ